MNLNNYEYYIEKKYRDYFKEQEISLSTFLDIELILLAFYRLTSEFPATEAWSILTGNEYVAGRALSANQSKMLKLLQLRYRDNLGKESFWKENLEQYQEVSEYYRLFVFYEGKLKIQNPKFDLYSQRDVEKIVRAFRQKDADEQANKKIISFPSSGSIKNLRLFVYYQILKAIPKFKSRQNTFSLSSGKYLYVGGLTTPRKEFVVNKTSINLPILDEYKEKKYFLRNEEKFDRVQLGKEMGIKWEKQAQRSSIYKNKNQQNILPYNGQFMLLSGGVGVGKNAFIEEEIYRLHLKEKMDVRILVVVRTNQAGLDLHRQLGKMNIDSVFIPGIYNKHAHEKEFVERLLKDGEDFKHFLEVKETLNTIDSTCLFHIYHDVEREENALPCSPSNKFRKIIDDKEQYCPCPYMDECGIMRPFLKMNESNVWITTPYALKSTSIPRAIDPENRTLQQAVNDLVDIVFIDEVDEAMSIYDSESIQETQITGGIYALNSVLQLDSRKALYSSQSHYSNAYVNQWIEHLHRTDSSIFMLHQLLENHQDFNHLFENRSFNLYLLASRLLSYVDFKKEDQNNYYTGVLLEYLVKDKKPLERSGKLFLERLEKAMENITKLTSDRISKRKEAEQFFKDLKWSIKTRKKGKYSKQNNANERAELTLELFLYIYLFEQNFRVLVMLYPIIKDSLALISDNMNFVMGNRNKLISLLASPPTGNRFGYRLKRNSNQGMQQLHILRYNGQTRKLLVNFSENFSLFNQKRTKKGDLVKIGPPTIIGLSGTAYVPGSPHFHVPVQQVYKLKNRFIPSKIECFTKFIPSMEEGYDYLYVSGSSNDERKQFLEKMTSESYPLLQKEIDHWEKKGEKRKVLIVTTSYEDARTVAKTFLKSDKWKNKFSYLYRKEEKDLELLPHKVHPSDVEKKVPESDVDVLIAPLSVIARGYNILQLNTNRSYFGTMFLFVRPYYIVDDMDNIYKLLHDHINNNVLDEIKYEDLKYGSYVKKIHKESQAKLSYLLTKPFYGRSLSDIEMKQLSLFTLVLTQQTLGRLQRGDTDARLIVFDSKLHYHSEEVKEEMEEKNKEISMINVWTALLNEHKKNDIINDCFGALMTGLNEITDL